MGMLRLLTNTKVMGVDVTSRAEAWDVYTTIQQDPRVIFVGESSALEDSWRSMTQSQSSSPGDWTDAYLLAFAKTLNLTLVTFDQALQTTTGGHVLTLR